MQVFIFRHLTVPIWLQINPQTVDIYDRKPLELTLYVLIYSFLIARKTVSRGFHYFILFVVDRDKSLKVEQYYCGGKKHLRKSHAKLFDAVGIL